MRARVPAAVLAMALAGCASGGVPAPTPREPADPVRLGSGLWQSDESVLALAASPDAKLLATGDAAGRVRLLDAGSGSVLCEFADHDRAVQALAFSADGRRLASVGNGKAVLRLIEDGAVLGEVKAPTPGYYMFAAAAFSPDGATLAVGGVDAGVILLDAVTGRETGRWNLQTWGVSSLSFSTDGKAVVCGCGEGAVRVVEVTSGRVLRTYRNAKSSFTPWYRVAAFLDDAGTVGSVRHDGFLDRWGVDGTGGTLLEDPGTKFPAAALSPARDWITVAARDGTLRWLDPTSGAETARFQVSERALLAVAFVGGPDRVAVAGEDGAIRILDSRTGAVLAGPDGHLGPVYCVAVAPDGRSVVTGGRDGTVRTWDTVTGKELRVDRLGGDPGQPRPVYGISFDENGECEVDAGASFRWDFDREPADTVPGLREATQSGVEVMAVAHSPDGHTVWAARSDGTVVGYDRESLRAATMGK